MKNMLIMCIKISTVSFLSVSLLHSAAGPNWNILQLYKTTIYVGLTLQCNLKDMHMKKIPLALGENQQQLFNQRKNYNFYPGSIESFNYQENIYLNKDTILTCWFHPIIKIVEPRIVLQDAYNPHSFFYIADRLKLRISNKPVRLEYHGSFAQIEAKKDLKKCYEALFLYNNDKKDKSIGLLPLKIDISLLEMIQIGVESVVKFITQHQESYAAIYILVNDSSECTIYTDLLNRCINNTK